MPPLRQRSRIHTKTWWQAKTGWTDDEYGDRLLALHDRLEAKWPEWLSAASLGPTWNVGSLKEWLQPFVLTINDANWCAPGRNLEERVDEQVRHYIGWALDFRMRPDNQDTIAAIAERHQGRHGQQTAFTQQDVVHAVHAVQWNTNTSTAIATYAPPQLPQNMATINTNELERYITAYTLTDKARILAVFQDAIQPALHNAMRPALESMSATSKLIATAQHSLEDAKISIGLSLEALLRQQ